MYTQKAFQDYVSLCSCHKIIENESLEDKKSI